MLLILLIIFLIHFIFSKNKYDLIILSLILLCYILDLFFNKETKETKEIKETYINFDPDGLKDKLIKINSVDEIKNRNVNNFYNQKTQELNTKMKKTLSIINDIQIKIDELLNSSLLKINNIKDKIKLIASVILVSFKILFNISRKLKDFNDINHLIKLLFEYTLDELKLIDLHYQEIKVNWDKCFETNSISRYVGFNTNCDKAFKKTMKLKKDIFDLPNKIYEKYNSLNFKTIDIKDLNDLLNQNKTIFKNSLTTFENNKENANIDLNAISNELELSKNKMLLLNK